MVVHFRPVFVRRSILSLCIALTFVVYGNAEIPKDWLKTCTAVPETKQCDEILKEACFNQTKQCQGMIQKVPDIPLEIICLRVCDVKNATTIDDRPHLCNICLARRGNRCSKKYSTLQLCWSDDVDEECKEIFHECGMGDIKYCESLYIYTKFCRELNSTDGYINWYEKYCYKPRGRCTTLIESLRKRDLHIVYPMCMEFCERTQDLCMKCIEQYRAFPTSRENTVENPAALLILKFCEGNMENQTVCQNQAIVEEPIVYSICMNLCEHSHGLCETCIEQYRSRHIPPEWRNDIGHPADLLTVKYCVGNVKNKIICTAGRAEKNTGVSEQTDDNDNPNMRVVYIVGTIVAALIIIIFGVIIYLFFEMRQRRRRNKNKHNKSDTGVSSAVSGVSSTMSEDNSATRVRTLASQPTVSQFATESHMSGKDRTRKGKKQTKKKESQVGMGDDSRTGSRETVREGHSKKLESQLGNTTFNVSNTNIDYEITKGEGKRARAKPSTTKGRDTETGGDTKIWEADKTTRKEGATEVDYELTMGEGKQPKKPNVRRKATETETGNETERVSEMK